MGYGNTIPTDGRPQGAMSVHSRIKAVRWPREDCWSSSPARCSMRRCFGDSDTSGSLWFGVLVGLYMLAYGIVKRLSLTILPGRSRSGQLPGASPGGLAQSAGNRSAYLPVLRKRI